MSGTMIPKVTKHTRAPHDGKLIYCPKCGNENRVYHFSWCGKTCQSCWQMVDKPDWLLQQPDKDALPKPLPAYFEFHGPDEHVLFNGDGSETGLTVISRSEPGHMHANIMEHGQWVDSAPHPAGGKSKAMDRLKARKGG